MTGITRIRIAFALLSFTFCPTPGLAKDDFASTLKGNSLWLRPKVNSSRKAYFALDDRTFAYEMGNEKLVSLSHPVLVEIERCSERDLGYEIRIRNRAIGKARMSLYAEDGDAIPDEAIGRFIDQAFSSDSIVAARPRFLGRRESGILHAAESNHCPLPAESDEFSDTLQALASNYKLCPLCFSRIPAISGFHEELALGQQVASQIRAYSPSAASDSLNTLVEDVGRKVLSNWPLPRKGYTYDFSVLEDRAPNAIACPGGLVFVTTGLLDVIESKEELEGVLAHELAHVELRHGYRQLQRSRRASLIGGIVSTVVGVAAASQTGDARDAVLIYEGVRTLGELAVTIALTGYSRRSEEEADAFALAYLSSRASGHIASDSYVRMLRKLQYHANVSDIPEGGTSLFQSHPDIHSRIIKASGCRADFFTNHGEFEFYDAEESVVATLSLQMQTHAAFVDWAAWSEQRTRDNTSTLPVFGSRPKKANEVSVYTTLETSRTFGDRTRVREIKIKSGRTSYMLDNKEDTEVTADDLVGAIFVSRKMSGFLPSEIDEVELMFDDRTLKWSRKR